MRGIELSGASVGIDGGLRYSENVVTEQGVKRISPIIEEVKRVAIDEQHIALLYVHRYNEVESYILYDKEYGKLYNGDIGDVIAEDVDVREVRSTGYVLIVLCADKIRYYMYSSERETTTSYYEFMPDALPRIIFVESSATEKSSTIAEVSGITSSNENGQIMEHFINLSSFSFGDEVFTGRVTSNFGWLADQVNRKLYKDSLVSGRAIVRYGLRLYDGSYLYVSPPILLGTDNKIAYKAEAWVHNPNNGMYVKSDIFRVWVEKEGYGISLQIPDRDSILAMNADVNPSIDIFMSIPDSGYSYEEDTEIKKADNAEWEQNVGNSSNYEVRFDWDINSRYQEFDYEKTVNYYKIKSISVEQLQQDIQGIEAGVYYEISLDDIGESLENIEQNVALLIKSKPHEYNGAGSLVYNSRLHIYDITERLSGGYGLPYYCYKKAGAHSESQIESVSLMYYKDSGIDYVSKLISRGTKIENISPLIAYPDSRVYRIVMAYAESVSGAIVGYKKIDILLREHPLQDMSYSYDAIEWVDISEADYEQIKNTPINNIISKPNVLKVSELDNPMLFPNGTTYIIGSNKIEGLAIAHRTISQGQFGQYPLYVFTDRGIYGMQAALSDVVYSVTSPINAYVMQNKNMLCSIEDAVVFGTAQGLYVLRGGEVLNITQVLDEYGKRDSQNAYNIDNVVQKMIGKELYTTPLENIISNGRLAYNYKRQELYMYIPNSGVVYVYSLLNGMWSSRQWDRLSYTVDDYPNLLVIRDNYSDGITICSVPDEVNNRNISDEVLVVTQPMSMGDVMNYKKLHRLHLLSNIVGNDEEQQRARLHVGVAVSNDGETWRLAWEREMEMSDAHNLRIAHVGGSWRYYTLIIHGKGMGVRSYMRGVVADYDVKMVER